MSRNITLLPKKHTMRKLLLGLGLVALLAWVINQPHQAANAVHTVVHGVSVFLTSLGG
ncbi:hypothetical protein [Amycolatopsis sp. GM8]|uniref:hypothetical protein n=1 Tax=Amycolatopsis sp. GM8 TaxID=2896530 RepID=UPI001F3789C0|nr:hypothetical protein [Amycolatopsis sp. GM8]